MADDIKTSIRITARLDITSWSPSLGGEHFTGRITWSDDNGYRWDKVEHKLTAWEAKDLNKKDGTPGMYRAGSVSNRYPSRIYLMSDATNLAKKHGIFFLAVHDVCQAGLVVYCADKCLFKSLSLVGDAFERLYEDTNDPWIDHPKEAVQLERKWEQLIEIARLVE